MFSDSQSPLIPSCPLPFTFLSNRPSPFLKSTALWIPIDECRSCPGFRSDQDSHRRCEAEWKKRKSRIFFCFLYRHQNKAHDRREKKTCSRGKKSSSCPRGRSIHKEAAAVSDSDLSFCEPRRKEKQRSREQGQKNTFRISVPCNDTESRRRYRGCSAGDQKPPRN